MVRIGFVKTDKSLSMNGITLSARESSIKFGRCAMFKFMLLIVLFLLSIRFSALAEQAFETVM
jgi:hypothetical protein